MHATKQGSAINHREEILLKKKGKKEGKARQKNIWWDTKLRL